MGKKIWGYSTCTYSLQTGKFHTLLNILFDMHLGYANVGLEVGEEWEESGDSEVVGHRLRHRGDTCVKSKSSQVDSLDDKNII